MTDKTKQPSKAAQDAIAKSREKIANDEQNEKQELEQAEQQAAKMEKAAQEQNKQDENKPVESKQPDMLDEPQPALTPVTPIDSETGELLEPAQVAERTHEQAAESVIVSHTSHYVPEPQKALKTADNRPGDISVFSNIDSFVSAQRMAKLLADSSLVPERYQNNVPNCVIALEMANRIGASALMVMQNLYMVHGNPGWSAQFVIASLNSCGHFSPLRFDVKGEGDDRSCTAWATELRTGQRLDGSPVTIKMAKAEGWFGKNGSKWQTMPEQMLRYRAAAFFGRLYAPEIMMGMRTADELNDVIEGEIIDYTPKASDITESLKTT